MCPLTHSCPGVDRYILDLQWYRFMRDNFVKLHLISCPTHVLMLHRLSRYEAGPVTPLAIPLRGRHQAAGNVIDRFWTGPGSVLSNKVYQGYMIGIEGNSEEGCLHTEQGSNETWPTKSHLHDQAAHALLTYPGWAWSEGLKSSTSSYFRPLKYLRSQVYVLPGTPSNCTAR